MKYILWLPDLPNLTLAEMKEMGIPLGHRKRLHHAFANLVVGTAPKSACGETYDDDARLSYDSVTVALNDVLHKLKGSRDDCDDIVVQTMRLCLLCLDASRPIATSCRTKQWHVEEVRRSNVVLRLSLDDVSFELRNAGSEMEWVRAA